MSLLWVFVSRDWTYKCWKRKDSASFVLGHPTTSSIPNRLRLMFDRGEGGTTTHGIQRPFIDWLSLHYIFIYVCCHIVESITLPSFSVLIYSPAYIPDWQSVAWLDYRWENMMSSKLLVIYLVLYMCFPLDWCGKCFIVISCQSIIFC